MIAALQIPEGGKLDSFHFTTKCLATDLKVTGACFYEIHGFMIPIPDPDGSQTPDEVWNLNVVKDTPLVVTAASSELEVDTLDTEDSSVVDEIGVPALQNLMQSWGPKELMAPHVKMLTVADSIGGFKDATPDTFLPRDIFSTGGDQGWFVEQPSMALFAFGSPTLAATVNAWFEADTPAEWAQLQYLEYILEQAFIEVSGLTEAGSETPWADAATIVVATLIAFFEETASSFLTMTWTAFTQFQARVTVPGTFQKASLDLGW